ncbi:MAG: alkaline phosphatase family protein [Methanocella sp.]
MRIIGAAIAAFSLFFVLVVSGCVGGTSDWAITINGDSTHTINSSLYESLAPSGETINGTTGVTLEEFLYRFGVYPVTAVTIGDRTYDWAWFASTTDFDTPVLVLPNGSIFDGQNILKADKIVVNVTERPARSSLDIEPSLLYALGLGGNDTLIHAQSQQVVVFYVDAMGYNRYEAGKSLGIIDNITSLGEPVQISCVYPSVSIVNSKTLVSGLAPNASKGDLRSYYPDGPTILDTVYASGMTGYWIDGRTSPVNLGNYVIKRPDANKDGYEASEVVTEAIGKYDNGANLLFVHFKDTDSAAHAGGPLSDRAMAALEFADQQIGRMLPYLDHGTIVIIYADHGGHTTFDGGNHGTLIPEDMNIPFIVHVV